jgi:general stress protein 26
MIDRQSLLEVMDRAEAVYLATVNGGGPRIRAMVNLRRADLYPGPSAVCRAEGFASFFATSLASGKVSEIRANPAVSVYYCDPGRFLGITFSGRMEILTSPELKKALWDDGWLQYWPTGAGDPDYVVLRLRPATAAGWWKGAPFCLELDKL